MTKFTKEQLIEGLKASMQNSSDMFEISEGTICALMSMLAATPAPTPLPDEMPAHIGPREFGRPQAYIDGWNAYRAAMLKSFGNSEQLDEVGSWNNHRNTPTAQACTNPAITYGWVMVPVEPTMEMLDEFDSIIDYGAEDSKDAWSRLIAAAPKQEVNRG